MVVGAVLAVVQRDVKRMLAYSSINHAGFILVAIEANTARGVAGALFYLLAYAFMVIGSFAVVTLVGRRGDAAHDLDDYRGLSTQRPVLALAMTVFLLSQAGVPLTAGFFAKFYVIGAAADADSYALAIIAMVTAVISAFLYLRIIVAMYFGQADGDDEGADQAPARARIAVPLGAGLSLAVAVAFTLAVGVLPDLVADLARDAVPGPHQRCPVAARRPDAQPAAGTEAGWIVESFVDGGDRPCCWPGRRGRSTSHRMPVAAGDVHPPCPPVGVTSGRAARSVSHRIERRPSGSRRSGVGWCGLCELAHFAAREVDAGPHDRHAARGTTAAMRCERRSTTCPDRPTGERAR